MPEQLTTTPAQTAAFACELAESARNGDIWLLTGELGAGKTCFAQGFATGLGVSQSITSPTYPIVLSYDSGRLPFNHLDLYRLENVDQLDDIAFDDVLASGGVTLIEWGDRFERVKAAATGVIYISFPDESRPDLRRIKVEGFA